MRELEPLDGSEIIRKSGLDSAIVENILQIYENLPLVSIEEAISDKESCDIGKLECAICKFNLVMPKEGSNNNSLTASSQPSVVKLQGCKPQEQHYTHRWCFARDLSTL